MAQPQNVANGVPPQFNGLSSAHSSRDSSPLAFPNRPNIPSSQLPPSRSPLSLTQKIGQLNISTQFGTSTPNQTLQPTTNLASAFSPINPVKAAPPNLAPTKESPNPNQNVYAPTPLNTNQPRVGPVNASHGFPPQGSILNQANHQPEGDRIQTRAQPIGMKVMPTPGPLNHAFPPQNRAQPIGINPVPTSGLSNHAFPPLNRPPPTGINQSRPERPPNHAFPPLTGINPSRPDGPPNHAFPPLTGINPSRPDGPPNHAFPPPTGINPSRPDGPPKHTFPPQTGMNHSRPEGPPNHAFPPQTGAEGPISLPPRAQPIGMNQVPLKQNFPAQFANQGVPQFPLQNRNVSQPIGNQGLPPQNRAPPQPPLNHAYPAQNRTEFAPQPLPPPSTNQATMHSNRYPQQQYAPPQPVVPQQPYGAPPVAVPQQPYGAPQPTVPNSGFNRLWGQEHCDLLQNPNVLPRDKMYAPKIFLGNDVVDSANCSVDVFRCTVTKIPESSSLLQKSRLPLGVLIHPFKDLNHLPVIQCNVIVRCRACRTYINPFVIFVDTKRWKCNLCYRINELPDEFQFDPVSKTYGDPSRRPEIRSSTIEYIAPAEYMLRPPQPAVYLFLFDISRMAVESGYLQSACSVLSEELKSLPGDARTQVGVIGFDSALHFFALGEGLSQPHEMIVLDIEDIFLPCPDNLLVNLKDRSDLLTDLIQQLPTRYLDTYDTNSAMGAALQAAYKMMSATGGRITVFQSALPNIGPGALLAREDPSQRASSEVAHLNPANDFYKRLALECSGQQIAVDLFIVNSQYVDIATISGISRFSGGCVHHFPLFKASRVLQNERFERCFQRYLTRKIGFEAVMRLRCTRGLSIHTFHGNFFVRSTDLLSLPNVNPDAGFGMQVSIDENLADTQSVCFQAALLYTSSKGERRIRVHTLCLPVTANLSDLISSADQQCIVGLLAKMAVDRSMQSSLADAREAFINVAIDILSSYKLAQNMGSGISGLLAPECLKLLPLYISALLKYPAFRIGNPTRLDDRSKTMIDMKTKPLHQLLQFVYPDLYPVHNLDEQPVILNMEEEPVPQPPHMQLTARCLDSKGAFLMDTGEHMVLLVGPGVSATFLNEGLGVRDYVSISEEMYELPILDNLHNQRLHQFISYLNDEKPFPATLHVIRDNSPNRVDFFERLIEDRMENALSYHEFLQHLKTQVK